jgi:hypothetical protein
VAENVSGMDRLRERLAKLGGVMALTAGAALYEAAREGVEAPAMDNCPIAPDGGTLRGTIETLAPEVEDGRITCRVVAGGPAAPYAIAVHEHLSDYSPPTWRKAEESGRGVHFQVGGPKYLERALNAFAPGAADEVAKRFEIRDAWEETD